VRLFTTEERRILQLLTALFLVGLLTKLARDYWELSGEDEREQRRRYLAAFRTGAQRYQAAAGSDGSGGILPARPVDINRAGSAELQAVKGIGPVLAKKIIDYRSKNGYFLTIQDLAKVDGIGAKLIARWEKQLIVKTDSTIEKDPTGE
jgi:competence protein ComEA